MRSVLITGANRGLGLALAQLFLEKGDKVLACCRAPESAQELHALSTRFPALQILKLDVTDQAQIDALQKQLAGEALDILINNASILSGCDSSLQAPDSDPSQTLGSLNAEGLVQLFKVNTIAPLMVTQALMAPLRAGKTRKIIMISSGWSSISKMEDEGPLGYSASKTALNAATKKLAITLQNEKFVVLTLNPGWMKTDMGGKDADWTPAQSAARLYPIIEAATPEQSGSFLRHTGEKQPW